MTGNCISDILQLPVFVYKAHIGKGRGMMISFDSFTALDGIPIYLQIIKHIKSGMVSGTVKNGDEVPSRRVLSALLGLNPNTIQKAYKLL